MKKWKYELTFFGAAMESRFPKYKRYHATREGVQTTIVRVGKELARRGISLANHSPVVLDENGKVV